jgi:hypothetical protein
MLDMMGVSRMTAVEKDLDILLWRESRRLVECKQAHVERCPTPVSSLYVFSGVLAWEKRNRNTGFVGWNLRWLQPMS